MPMKKLSFIIILLFSACNNTPAISPLSEGDSILAFGDSITYGTGASWKESYPHRLQALISNKILSSGIPGEVTADALKRLPEVLERYSPRLLLLCEGTNDMGMNLDDKQTAKNIREMIKLTKKRGIEVVLIGAPRPGSSLNVPEFYRDIAREFKIPYEGEALKKILLDSSLRADPIHPNRDGYRVMADAIAVLLKERGAIK